MILRNASVETTDLMQIGAQIDTDGTSSLVTGNLGPPVVTPSLISIDAGAIGFAAIGQSGAVVDPDAPLTVTVSNLRSGAVFTAAVANDGSFSVALAGQADDAFTLIARDSHRFPLQSAEVAIGTMQGAPPSATEVAATGWGVDGVFVSRTLSLDGHQLAVAGWGSSSELVLLDLSNPAVPALVRTSVAAQGAIRDVVIRDGWAYVAADRFSTLDLSASGSTPNYTTDPCGREQAVALSGGYAFTAEVDCLNNGTIHVYDVTNPAAPRYLSSQAVAGVANDALTDLLTFGRDDLVGISDTAAGIDVMVIDRRDVNALRKVSQLSISNFGAYRASIEGTTLFLVSVGTPQLVAVDLSDPLTPIVTGTLALPGSGGGVMVAGRDVLIADGAAGLVATTADPAALVITGSVPTAGTAYDVAVYGTTTYVADGSGIAVVPVAIAPRIDPRRISIGATSITGLADAVTGAVPITIEIVEGTTMAAANGTVAPDGGFSVPLTGSAGDTITLEATDASGRVAGPIVVGTVPFGSSTELLPLSNRARTITAWGTTVAM
ncbi:MAG TPA: hypothetical protein VKH35_01065, partial [Thermoanaerobaculia bacterium]|nr:hypothetical protein [Thermoanaerobaculia bacterium]